MLRRLRRAMDRIDAARNEKWPVTKLVRVSGVSPAHLARSFKGAFGVSPHRFLLTRRIEGAEALLGDTELRITDVAFAAGWTSLGTAMAGKCLRCRLYRRNPTPRPPTQYWCQERQELPRN